MADAPAPLASAVIVPDPIEEPIPSPTAIKRRQSSISENHAKRPRLSQTDNRNGSNARSLPLEDNNTERQGAGRRPSNQLEERKRGQRLFGALLGTLSQSSSSTAQKRRKDIEQKQTAKLRHEADEFDEKKKQRLEVLTNVRRREQEVYDRQSMSIRHSNTLAQAHFLQTKAEPRLHYKPWEFRDSEKEKIKSQMAEVEAIVEKDRQNATSKEELSSENPRNITDIKDTEMEEASVEENREPIEGKVGSDTNSSKSTKKVDEGFGEVEKHGAPTGESENIAANINEKASERTSEETKDHGDDQGDLVEGDEDAVIY